MQCRQNAVADTVWRVLRSFVSREQRKQGRRGQQRKEAAVMSDQSCFCGVGTGMLSLVPKEDVCVAPAKRPLDANATVTIRDGTLPTRVPIFNCQTGVQVDGIKVTANWQMLQVPALNDNRVVVWRDPELTFAQWSSPNFQGNGIKQEIINEFYPAAPAVLDPNTDYYIQVCEFVSLTGALVACSKACRIRTGAA